MLKESHKDIEKKSDNSKLAHMHIKEIKKPATPRDIKYNYFTDTNTFRVRVLCTYMYCIFQIYVGAFSFGFLSIWLWVLAQKEETSNKVCQKYGQH